MTLTYRGRIELGVAAVTIAIGLFFALLALDIRPGRNDPIGSRALPLFLAFTIMGLGLLIGVLGWRDRTPEAALAPDYGFRSSDLAQVAQVIGAGAVYVALFFALGYMAATAIGFVLILAAFGVRNALTVIALAAGAAVLYQFVFMGLMGLNDPAGAWVDARGITSIVSGQ